jgi:hypothetical protein
VLQFAGNFQLAEGERARAPRLWREVEELAERTRVVSVRLMVLERDALLAIVDGHLEAVAQVGGGVPRPARYVFEPAISIWRRSPERLLERTNEIAKSRHRRFQAGLPVRTCRSGCWR